MDNTEKLATAAASSGTYGFNAGIEFDIDALERQLQAQQTQSIASSLIANKVLELCLLLG
jgi:hypothetical protein